MLSRLNSQSIHPDEIIVVDSNSDDSTTDEVIRSGVLLLSVDRSSFDHGGTRNFAASHATGDVLVFMTQDALPADNHFLESIINPFVDKRVAAVCGRQIAQPEANPLEKMARDFNYPPVPMRKSITDVAKYGIKTFFFSNVCSAVRREVFQSVGGFPEPIISNEDMILAARFLSEGHLIVYEPQARVIHSHDYTLKQQFQRYFDIGVSLRMNDWLLRLAKPEGEGGRLVATQFRRLTHPKLWVWIPRWIGELVAKYTGYRLGLSYRKLPLAVLMKCSMHSFFWRRGHQQIK